MQPKPRYEGAIKTHLEIPVPFPPEFASSELKSPGRSRGQGKGAGGGGVGAPPAGRTPPPPPPPRPISIPRRKPPSSRGRGNLTTLGMSNRIEKVATRSSVREQTQRVDMRNWGEERAWGDSAFGTGTGAGD